MYLDDCAAGQRDSPTVGQLPTIGILTSGRLEPFLTVFRGALQEMGYVEGRNFRFEIRGTVDGAGDLPALTAELVRSRVDVIVALAPAAGLAAKNATRCPPSALRTSATRTPASRIPAATYHGK